MAHEQIHGGIVRAGTPGVSLQVILGFLAIGLPEALLGASWPAMGAGVHAPLVAVVGIAAVLAAGSAAAAITAEPVVRRFGSGRTVDMGVALTVLALLGFSFAPHYWVLLVFALPYGIGSGMLVVALNAYVAVRSANARITWLHATTAFGALVGHTRSRRSHVARPGRVRCARGAHGARLDHRGRRRLALGVPHDRPCAACARRGACGRHTSMA
ncbi:hypothetical protein LJD78_03850 [Bifidobacterium pseudolongum]|nr:hypothetical protein [Bifidobacterium pseudolongum]UBZ03766.1 hypothetical protein LDH93_03850 [Bifidobacterium pseudolongum]UBZ05338.1 hypothetical protein LDX67_03845 [Bifidobacterium pseudolongum]UDL24348.1 hypothetical protein LJD78_03850 [Bifidobacterium pseudolongum]